MNRPPAQIAKFGTGCGMLFLLPFLLVGLGACGLSYYRLMEWVGMQSWEACPATITRVEQLRGDDTTGVDAEYEYVWQGKQYHATRVGLHGGGTDNIGSFQRDTFGKLSRLKGQPGAAECFVNPAAPDNAVLIRDPRWEMFAFMSIFACLFGSVGLLGFSAVRTVRRAAARAAEDSGAAASSQLTEITSDSAVSLRFLRIAAVWWVLAAVPPGTFAVRELTLNNWKAVLGLIPAVIAVLLLRAAIRRFRQERLVGRMTLQLQQPQLRRGETTVVALMLERRVGLSGPVETKLTAKKLFGEQKIIDEIRESVDAPPTQVVDDHLVLGLTISIPDAPRYDPVDSWKLNVAIPVAGSRAPVSGHFDLPVESARRRVTSAPDAEVESADDRD